jgi:hypothetical protein
MRRTTIAVAVIGWLAGCSGSSGGSGGPAACTTFMACGGNLAGTWNVTTACGPGTMVTQTGFLSGCDASSLTATIISASGALTFNADMTYSSSVTEALSSNATIPKSCLPATTTCSAFETALKAEMGVTSASCADGGTNCSCAIGQNIVATESGTYTTSGSTLTTTPTAGTPASAQYCVSGNQASFSGSDMFVLVATK